MRFCLVLHLQVKIWVIFRLLYTNICTVCDISQSDTFGVTSYVPTQVYQVSVWYSYPPILKWHKCLPTRKTHFQDQTHLHPSLAEKEIPLWAVLPGFWQICKKYLYFRVTSSISDSWKKSVFFLLRIGAVFEKLPRLEKSPLVTENIEFRREHYCPE